MNALITEGKDDGYFAAALIEDINTEKKADYFFERYTALGGLDERTLVEDLKGKIGEIRRGKIQRIGILIDQDLDSKAKRLSFLNEVIKKAYGKENVLENTDTLYLIDLDEETSVEVACHFMNINGKGELETVLRAIKTKASPHADCLNTWRDCLEAQGAEVKEKEFVKSWIRDYIRLDTCSSSKFRGNKAKYCSMNCLDNILARKGEKAIFDLKAKELTDLRVFLSLFKKINKEE